MTISNASEVIKRVKVASKASPLAVFTVSGQYRFDAFPANTVRAQEVIKTCADRFVGVFDNTMCIHKIKETLQNKISKNNKHK